MYKMTKKYSNCYSILLEWVFIINSAKSFLQSRTVVSKLCPPVEQKQNEEKSMDSSQSFVQEVENRERGIKESLGEEHERTGQRNLGYGANHMMARTVHHL